MSLRIAVAALLVSLFTIVDDSAHAQNTHRGKLDTESDVVRRAFLPVTQAVRNSVVRLLLDGEPAALGTVVGDNGLVLTKASELTPVVSDDGQPAGPGVVTALLPTGQRAAAQRLAVDRQHDLALLRVKARGLRPVVWADPASARLGQWVVVPGTDELPEAVGIYSAAPREITGVRLGIHFGPTSAADPSPMIGYTIPGMGAAEAGLHPGDVIRAVAERPTPTVDDVIDSLRGVNAGDVVPVVIERAGMRRVFPVEMRLRELDRFNRADWMNTMGNDVSRRRDGFPSVFQHDATIDPSQCGGPVLNLDGRAVGINIARGGRIEAYALPVDVVLETLAELQSPVLIHGPDPDDPARPTR
ncbi:MAG: trypsin-like peptidase domain-containing protein [Planctomycetota bacterium]